MSMSGWSAMRSLTRDGSVKDRKLAPGTARRVMGYALPFKRQIVLFLVLVVISAALVVATPLLLKDLIDNGITPRNRSVVVGLSLVVALLAVADAVLTLVERWYSSRIGEGLIYSLRTEVFAHVLRQPIGFFTRAQTGALVTRLNSDVIGAQQAFTSVLSSVVSNVVSLTLIIAAMASLSWQLTLASLALVPFFLIPARVMGRRLSGLTHAQMNLNADLGSRMTERFNVAGALLVKLFGDPRREDREYSAQAADVRDIGCADRVEPQRLLRRPHPGRLVGDGDGLRVRRHHGRQRYADRRHPDRPHRSAGPALRPADVPVERPGRRHDRAGLLRAGLRGARPQAPGLRAPRRQADPRGPGRHRGRRRRLPLPVRRRGVARLPGERRRR